ncbi:CueP family metal-binding protein [Paenibacillus sp. MMS20-IR301]|uniref:CueP family metal-binding protein n=1 Tax=Paenibacillus sp. MMS20-IR301 TaxID=2895946 RepID=UPI0028E23655|nr:CueP family metal-binding protein [Paenibacillus sp. MMS20-IR301]WNS46408.1 CueP family metal-binding protein [Paenibacillus sp. MMS20-IR301]
MRKKLVAGTCAVVAAIGIFWYAGNEGRKPADSEAAFSGTGAAGNTAGLNIKQMVADYSSRSITSESASITSTQLIVDSGGPGEAAYALPEDEFFLSVAPYVNKTHPCATHSLTGCQGELPNEEFEVYIEDAEGKEVMNGAVKSQPNGFIDLWLPRDQKLQITITRDGKQAKTDISTFESDDTCLTTMQLS